MPHHVQAEKYGYCDSGKQLGQAKGKPDTMCPQQFRKQHKARYKEDETAQKCQDRSREDPFEALELTYYRKVENEKHACSGNIRESFDSQPCRRIVRTAETPHEPGRRQR